MDFALLQCRLDQTIDRADMEDASTAAPQIGRADCARLQRQLFGIVVRRLDETNARAFQSALRARGFDTDLVPESDLLALPPSRRVAGLRLAPDALIRTDLYGRDEATPFSQVVFAAAGHITLTDIRQKRETVREVQHRGRFGTRIVERTVVKPLDVARVQWRLEFFFAADPLRIEWVLDPGRVSRLDGQAVRLADPAPVQAFMDALRRRLPPSRMNRGLARAGLPEAPAYPGPAAFDEEIVWHFHRLRAGGGGCPVLK